MDRWTIEQLKNMDDVVFATCILNERRKKLNPYAPLAEKIKQAVKTLEKISFERLKAEESA